MRNVIGTTLSFPMYSRNSSNHQPFLHQQHQKRDYSGNTANPSLVYPPIGHMGNQYMNSQPNYYSGPPVLNAPPTPFDTAYGVTLLPSHLLMGSPFVSSPDLFQHSQQPHQNHHHRHSNTSSGRNFSKLATSYPAPPPLNPPPMSRNAAFQNGSHNRRRSYYQLIHGNNSSKLFKEPFVITYTKLPKGNDEYRTRSLLFENVNSYIDLHSFVSKYSKYGPVESVYLFPDTNDESENSILLSFLSRKICLDFYNSVLQRLSEFKTGLNSKSLTLSFVALKYKVPGETEDTAESGVDDEAFNITAAASLHYDIISRGATRSIAVAFKSPCDKEELITKRLDFLCSSKENNRYILESIDLVTAKEPTKHFPQNYAILTLLNISMAVELLDYLRLCSQKLGISKCFFVSVLPPRSAGPTQNSASLSNSSWPENSNGNYTSKNASLTSLKSSGSFISLDQEVDMMTSKLHNIQLEKRTKQIMASAYPEPYFAEHMDHLVNVNISEAASLDSQISSPSPQEVSVNEIVVAPTELGDETDLVQEVQLQQSSASQLLPFDSQLSLNTTNSGYYMEPPSSRHTQMTKPITHSLQNQYNTSVEVATSMGGGIGNRTVYIGNIHPRSRAEDICNVVRGGILQSIKFLQDKHICFVTFIEASTAVQFYTNAFIEPIVLHGNMLKVGWGHHSGSLAKSIALAVTAGASRNVYVSLPEFSFKDKYINDPKYQEYNGKYKLPAEEQLRQDFNNYGDIEQINYLSDGHCCWVNFMNISAAIKLVEEVKYDDGETFHKKSQDRYKGLIIGYGKDRCGNVNKNLVAGKNSRFYKKVKKPSYNIRLNKMEEERKQHEEILRKQQQNNSEKLLQFGSLGITLEGNGTEEEIESSDENGDEHSKITSKTVEQLVGEESDLEGKELLKLSNKSQILDSFGISELKNNIPKDGEEEAIPELKNEVETDHGESTINSDASTDIELILHSPVGDKSELKQTGHRKNGKNNARKFQNGQSRNHPSYDIASAGSNATLEIIPPMAPATISRNYSLMRKNQNNNHRHGETTKAPYYEDQPLGGERRNGTNKTEKQNQTHRKKHTKRHPAKTIPGSDVMAQYLAQLQHSTFMYAANILGATVDNDGGYFDENAGT